MQALLLATGEAPKLAPLMETMPPAMFPVANRPVMSYAIEVLARHNVKQLLTSLYHLGGSIEAYFGTGERWGVELEYVLQRDAWGSAGAIKWASALIDETFVAMSAETLLDVDLTAVEEQHQTSRSSATIVVHKDAPPNDDWPTVWADSRGQVHPYQKPETTAYAVAGCYIFSLQVLDKIPARTQFDIEADLIPALLAAGLEVRVYIADAYWNPLQTFAQYHAAQHDVLGQATDEPANSVPSIRYFSVDGTQIGKGIWVGRHNVIHPTARLAPPVHIGDSCQIGRDVELGPYAIIGANVVIDDEATIFQSTILDHTYVGQLVKIENRFVSKRVMIDVETAESTEIVDNFLLSEADTRIIGGSFRRVLDGFVAFWLALLSLPLLLVVMLLTLLTTGRLLALVGYMGTKPGSGNAGSGQASQFDLFRIPTRRANNGYFPLGRLFEKLHWHRLPELWNIVRGDIAFVGVKPLLPQEAARVTEEWQRKRYDYPAGFTGLWFLQTNPDSELDEVLVSDAYYVATRNWREDLQLMLRTPAGWWRHLRQTS